MEIIKSKNELYTLKIEGIFLHSKYDPIKEAKIFAESNIKNFKGENLIIIGLGLGYHILETLKVLDNNVRVIVFEENYEIFKCCKCYGVLDEINKFSNVKILNNTEFEELRKELGYCDDIICYRPYLNVMKNKDLKAIFQNFCIAQKSIRKNQQLLNENYSENKKKNVKLIDEYINNFQGKRIIIAAAGPSLDMTLKDIEINKDKFKIISVGSAFKALINNGIKPDAVVIIDGQEVVKKQIEWYKDTDIPLIFLSTASRWAIDSFLGEKYMFFNEENQNSRYIITTGKTVAAASISIATKCSPEEIILVGQDLAYLNNRHHSKCYEEIYNADGEVKIESNNIIKQVEDINGKNIPTTSGYLYFKTQIEKIINDNKNIRFYNCSKGAKIKGTITKDFSEIL